MAGDYKLIAELIEEGRIISRASAGFTIAPDKRMDAMVTVDKISYSPNETITLSSTVTSLSGNYAFENLSARVEISSSGSNSLIGLNGPVFVETKTISTLMPGAAYTFKSYWNTGTYASGTYPVTLEIKDATGTVIATGTQNVVIANTLKPSAMLKGQIAVDKQSLLSGETVTISYGVTNTGNTDLENIALSVLTVHAVNESIYDTITDQASVAMGATSSNSASINTTNYSARDYLVILRANIAGVEETLAGTYFRVEGAPSAPSLAGPGQAADVLTFFPELSVNNASDPNDDKLLYEFEVYSDPGLANLITSSSGTVSEQAGITKWIVAVALSENQTYYWRTRAYDGKLYGPWMSIDSAQDRPASFRVNTVNDPPTAPIPTSPADGTDVSVLTPILTVTNAADPDSASLTYNFDVAQDPDFAGIVISAKGVLSGQGNTSWQPTLSLEENVWYYWRAQADDWLDEGPWSVTSRFFVNTSNDAPTAPSITMPADNSTVSALTADIIVANSTDPDSAVINYFIELDTAMTFDSGNVIRSGAVMAGQASSTGSGQDTTMWHVDGLRDNTRYYLRAKASDGAAESAWSSVVSFFANTANDAPTAPLPANPSNNAGVNVFMPTLSVHNSADLDGDALTYEFELYSDAAMLNPVRNASGLAETAQITSWTVPVSLIENQIYYWRARSFDGIAVSAWTALSQFTVNTANDSPGAPGLSSPAEGSSLSTTTPTLSITNAVDPDSDDLTCDFEIYSEGILVQSISGVAQDNTGITSITLNDPLSDNKTYQWRARAFDGDGYGPWMSMAAFSIHMPKTSINATIDFDPDTLNRASKGTWVVVYIEMPGDYKPADIDISSVRLEGPSTGSGQVPAEARPYAIGDHDKDRIPDLMVKFNRSEVINLLSNGEQVPVHVTGRVGTMTFEGVDNIRVIP